MSEGRAPGEATMRAAVLHAGKGAPEYGPFPEPLPGEGEVRVRVRAAGLHPVVKALAAGTHYGSTARRPLVPGVDGVGRLDDGTRVYFGFPRPPYGTLAEQSVVPRVRLVEIGESAGPTISLPAALLRGSGVELYGSGAGTAPLERIAEIMPRFLAAVAGGELRLDVEAVPLADVATAWEGPAPAGRRLVLVP